MREERKKQEFQNNRNKRKMKEQEFTETNVLKNLPKNLKELSRIVQSLTKLINDHMKQFHRRLWSFRK